MTINLTELRDEPLGKHPIPAMVCGCNVTCWTTPDVETAQDTAAPDDESSFTFDVEGLGDEALDDSPSVSAFGCVPTCWCDGLGDEALDDSPPVSAAACMFFCMCSVDGLADEPLDDSPSVSANSCACVSGLCWAGLGDEALDRPHTLTAQACGTCAFCFVKHRT